MARLIVIVANIFLINPVWAVDETILQNGYQTVLEKFLNSNGQAGDITSFDGTRLFYHRFDRDCNNVLILLVPGWSEPYIKYTEVIYDLVQHHYCVYTYDHRGQGKSARYLTNTQISYVNNFSDYVNDLQKVVENIMSSTSASKIYAIGHSMGGLIVLSHAADHPELYNGVITTGPMLQINTGIWPYTVAYSIVTVMDWMGFGENYVIGDHDYRVKPFIQSKTTNSEIRFKLEQDILKQNSHLIISGVSNHWLKTSMDYTALFKSKWKQVKQDLLLLQAGDEHFVMNEAEDEFCRVTDNCKMHRFADAKHELLMEKDDIRNEVFKIVFDFIDNGH